MKSIITLFLHKYRVSQLNKKDARFSKIKNIPDLLSDDEECISTGNFNSKCFIDRASFMGNPVLLKIIV